MYATSVLDPACGCHAGRTVEEIWERANLEYQVQRYGRALTLFEHLAAKGDDRAAELAGHMLLFGETLYGGAVPRDPARAEKWLALAAQAGRPVARHLLGKLSRDNCVPPPND